MVASDPRKNKSDPFDFAPLIPFPFTPMIRLRAVWFVVSFFSALVARAQTMEWVTETRSDGDFVLADGGKATPVVYSETDYKVVSLAAEDLARDIERVASVRPAVATTLPAGADRIVLVGTLGHSPQIDEWVTAGKLDPSALRGAWESFIIATVVDPSPTIKEALVIVGSDRRGTAFGIYELSQALGVSPWHWWADVAPAHKASLFVAAGTRRFGPPSVRYRGIFINDEDWGLEPWAAKTFEPERHNLGPKTYAKVFELLLRLKANTLWPAMHACSTPFNAIPENAKLADNYAIVMGSSHAEPMLRNNVGEWTAPHEEYDYLHHRNQVHAYWEERVRENGQYENLYTLGMRGIHDSGMQGPKSDPERIQVLEQVFADQRALLQAHVNPTVEQVPQIFCAYKEVLSLYRQGLKVPDDVTIVWPDDNFGYIRNFATPEQRPRSGGFGVYYHISYLGAPLSYLWLCTTPPALIWEEMSKAYDFGAQRVWILNVGDIKPAEVDLEFFLQLAWNIHQWDNTNLPRFLPTWAAREFGPSFSREIGSIMQEYYELNYARKPEHLQWWLPKENPRRSPLTEEEIQSRLNAFASLVDRLDPIEAKLQPEQRDAFFELVAYPVRGSALANERVFATEMYDIAQSQGDTAEAKSWSSRARKASAELEAATATYNEKIAGGKWRGIMSLEPADKQWSSMRISAPRLPPDLSASPETPSGPAKKTSPDVAAKTPSSFSPYVAEPAAADPHAPLLVAAIEAEHFDTKFYRGAGSWQTIPGLGRTQDSMAVYPTTSPEIPAEAVGDQAPRLDYDVTFPAAGEYNITVYLIPTHPIKPNADLEFYVGCDTDAPHRVAVPEKDGSTEWAQGVLNATRIATTTLTVPSAGVHLVSIYGNTTGIVLDKLVVHRGPLPASYLGPVGR